MPLFGPTYYCPNTDCEFEKPLKQGTKCPQCGAEAKPFGIRDWAAVYATKKSPKKTAAEAGKAAPKSGKGGYYCPSPTCANVKELHEGEKCPVCGTEAQSDEVDEPPVTSKPGEMDAPIFTAATTDNELRERIRLGVERLGGLDQQAAVYEQNNIIIMQNELILRSLARR